MDEHFIIEPVGAGQLRMSLQLTLGDTSIGIATHAPREAGNTSLHGLQADLLALAIRRMHAHMRALRALERAG